MVFVQTNSTFFIPFLRPNCAFGALSEFVGDEANEALRYLTNSETMRSSDWPIVLFGPTGTGKTELAYSVVAQNEPTPSAKPVYQTSVEFSRLFKSAVDTDSTREFRLKYEKASVLVLDDLHQLSRFPSAQQELVYLIDQLVIKNIPIITTANLPVQNIDGLIPQLASRLLNGLSFGVHPPGPAARKIIIEKLSGFHEATLDAKSVDFLVKRLPVTVPKINQFFIQFRSSNQSSSQNTISLVELADYFDQLHSGDQDRFAELIIQTVAKEFKLSVADLKGSSRKQTTAMARSIAIYLQRSLLKLSFTKIGSLYGGRDHSTIMHAHKKIIDIITDHKNENIIRIKTIKLESQLNELLAVNI